MICFLIGMEFKGMWFYRMFFFVNFLFMFFVLFFMMFMNFSLRILEDIFYLVSGFIVVFLVSFFFGMLMNRVSNVFEFSVFEFYLILFLRILVVVFV